MPSEPREAVEVLQDSHSTKSSSNWALLERGGGGGPKATRDDEGRAGCWFKGYLMLEAPHASTNITEDAQ